MTDPQSASTPAAAPMHDALAAGSVIDAPDESASSPPNDSEFAMHREQVLRKPPPTIFGSIDVGTNSIHLLMAEISPEGDFTILGRDKDMVQLGKGGFADHTLTQRAMDDGVDTLRRFLKMCELKGVTKVRAVATSAVREARNGGDFVDRVCDELGLNLHVISPTQEAQLIYLGVRHDVDFGARPGLIVDIGGGSVELIVGDGQKADAVHSVKLGGSRLAELYMTSDVVEDGQLKALRRQIRDRLDPVLKSLLRFSIDRCIGTSGTIKSLALLCRDERQAAPFSAPALRLTLAQIKSLVSKLSRADRAQRLAMPGMDAKRVDACVPAAMVLHHVLKTLDLDVLEHCDSALREGLIIDYIGSHRKKLLARATWPDPRTRSVVQLAAKCNYHKPHAEQVAGLALELFDELRDVHGMSDFYRELLNHACTLHDIGYLVSHQGHHKHSYYLIRNGLLKGFTEQEIEIIANIARYHRKERPKKSHYSFHHLAAEHRRPVHMLAAIIRLANALDRTHFGVVRCVACNVADGRLEILVHAEQDAELEIWTASRKKELFERVFELPVDIRLVTSEPASED